MRYSAARSWSRMLDVGVGVDPQDVLDELHALDAMLAPAALEVEVGHREMDGDGARRDLERPIAGVQRRVGKVPLSVGGRGRQIGLDGPLVIVDGASLLGLGERERRHPRRAPRPSDGRRSPSPGAPRLGASPRSPRPGGRRRRAPRPSRAGRTIARRSSERFVERGDGVGGAAHAQEDAAHAHPRQRAVASEPAGLLVMGDRLTGPALDDRDVAAAEGFLVAVGDRVRHGAMQQYRRTRPRSSAWCTAAPCGPASGRTSCVPSCADRA